ncbi:MAG: 5-formyltetrahydrofolate cyclo-ligase [Alphaproteobacteria bacterium RIFOXYD12_FULL_60_8]|nr:MAG: 5-formyltetrahydrofolate cyclo-ligase [Alphaproteobacteria bacterium RIFOXYD12_FULL_60_8]
MPSSHVLNSEKAALRQQFLAVRKRLFEEVGHKASVALARHALSVIKPEGVVAGYWPLVGEVDPRPLTEKLAARGQTLALPVVVGPTDPLIFRHWIPDTALEEGAHNTWHPPASAKSIRPDVVLVPLLAFDRRGVRLGFGGGYYDRTLESLRRSAEVQAIGLAFAGQEVDTLPKDRHDQLLDIIVTETGVVEGQGA